MQGGWDWLVLSYFVCCGVSRLAHNVTAEALSGDEGKVTYFEGTPIPTSLVLVIVLAIAAGTDAIGDHIWFGQWQIGPWQLHPMVLLFALSGSLMISKTLRIPSHEPAQRRPAMTSSAHDAGSSDFETLARQYFGAWGDALRHASTPGAPAGDDPGSWQRLFDWWGQLLPEQAQGAPDDAVRRFREQAGNWYGTMQDVAARFAGRDASSAEVAQAWREAVQAQGDGMLQWMLQGARGSTHAGAAVPEFAAWLQQFQLQAGPWLQSPAFGPGREHQARWQALLRAQEEYQQHSRAYVDQIRQALDEAFALFEQRWPSTNSRAAS